MSYASTVLADGAVGLWGMGDASGTTCTDLKGNQDGTYTNITGTTLGQTGIPGSAGATACLFTAANSGYVNVPDVAAQRVGNVFTIEAWVKLTSTGGDFRIVAGIATAMELAFTHPAMTLYAGVTGGGTQRLSSTGISADGNFHHIVWTRSGSPNTSNVLYIDGASAGSNSGFSQAVANSAGYKIGIYTDGSSAPMDGTMQYVALYPTALSSGTVSTHYTLGSTGPPPAVTSNNTSFDMSTAWTLLG